jgi:hypothetical protein
MRWSSLPRSWWCIRTVRTAAGACRTVRSAPFRAAVRSAGDPRVPTSPALVAGPFNAPSVGGSGTAVSGDRADTFPGRAAESVSAFDRTCDAAPRTPTTRNRAGFITLTRAGVVAPHPVDLLWHPRPFPLWPRSSGTPVRMEPVGSATGASSSESCPPGISGMRRGVLRSPRSASGRTSVLQTGQPTWRSNKRSRSASRRDA